MLFYHIESHLLHIIVPYNVDVFLHLAFFYQSFTTRELDDIWQFTLLLDAFNMVKDHPVNPAEALLQFVGYQFIRWCRITGASIAIISGFCLRVLGRSEFQ